MIALDGKTLRGLGGAFVAAGSLPVSTLAFLLALFYLTAPIGSLTCGAADLQQGLGAVARLREVSDLAIEDDVDTGHVPPPATARLAGPVSPRGGRIGVDAVSFAYRNRQPALRELSLGAAHLAAYAGLAPVTRRSGSSIKGESRSQRGNHALKSALFLSAFASLADPTSRAYYDRKKAEKKKHNAAVICLARRRLDVIYAMLRDRQPYRAPSPSPAPLAA